MLLLLGFVAAVAVGVYAGARDEWGKPLGRTYIGPEVISRPITSRAFELGADERTTIAVFEQAARSVVFIANSAIRRGVWTLNVFEVPQGSGSGVVWNEHGYIVTNFHVIYSADAITVTLADRTEHRARVVGIDPDHELVVLQIHTAGDRLAPVPIGTSRDLRVGQKVLAIGNPFGLDQSLTTGVVSAVGRTIRSMSNRTIDGVIQTDAAINPGNSGGPLLDSAGRLVGINTQIISPSGAYAGVGFAVPVDTINRVVPDLIKYGKVIRPGLGITLVPDEIAMRLKVSGLIIGRVIPGGPGEAVGLQGLREDRTGTIALGDVISKVDGHSVKIADELFTILDHHAVGDRVTIEFIREGHAKQATIVLQATE